MVSKSAANRDRLAAGQRAYRRWRARPAGKVRPARSRRRSSWRRCRPLPGSSGVVARGTSWTNFRWLASSRSVTRSARHHRGPAGRAKPRFVIPRAPVTAAAATVRPPATQARPLTPAPVPPRSPAGIHSR